MMDTKATVWNLVNGTKEIGSTASKSRLRDLQTSPRGDCFATASEDGTARVWSFEPVQPLSPPLIHKSAVLSVSFSSDENLLVTACADGTALIWVITYMAHNRPIPD